MGFKEGDKGEVPKKEHIWGHDHTSSPEKSRENAAIRYANFLSPWKKVTILRISRLKPS